MNQHQVLITGTILAGLSVAFGAFGAHALKSILVETGRTDTFELAIRYQFFHALALLITGALMNQFPSRHLGRAALCFTTGILFFSGSLYILCFSGLEILGAITPIGGLLFMAGWILLIFGFKKK